MAAVAEDVKDLSLEDKKVNGSISQAGKQPDGEAEVGDSDDEYEPW